MKPCRPYVAGSREAPRITLPNACASPAASTKDVGCFIAHYASSLMGCGATCIRIEKNVNRIARAYGKHAEITTLTRHIQITVSDHSDELDCLTLNIAVAHTPIDFTVNTRLSELSWEIADTYMPLAQAWTRFNSIIAAPGASPWIVILLASCANSAFCRLFGGDCVAMAVVFVATFAGFILKTNLAAHHADPRLTFFLCAFVSTVLAAADRLFSLGSTPDIAIATSVLYLVPGIPFLNSFSDLIYRHYLCALSRFSDALILTCCLSLGLCLGMLVMKISLF